MRSFLLLPFPLPHLPSLYCYFYIVQIYNIHILFWNHHCYDCLASVLHVNGSSDYQQFFWHGFTMLAFFILWIFRLPSFGYQAVLSNKCSWIFCFPEPLHLNCTWGHPLFSQNSALLSSTMNIMKSDTSWIFFFTLCRWFFSFCLEVWSILPLSSSGV